LVLVLIGIDHGIRIGTGTAGMIMIWLKRVSCLWRLGGLWFVGSLVRWIIGSLVRSLEAGHFSKTPECLMAAGMR